MLEKRCRSVAAALLALAAAAVPVSTLAQDESSKEEKIRVQVKRMHDEHHAGARSHSQLGVGLTPLSSELKAHFGMPDSSGVMVSKVLADSAAVEAGLEVGDIISAVDGEAVSSPADLSELIRDRDVGDTVIVEAWRDGKVLQLSATLTESEHPVRIAHRRVIRCEDGGEDCRIELDLDHDVQFDHHLRLLEGADLLGFDCDGGDCSIEIDCEKPDDCECTVNGESTDCPDLSQLHSRHR